MKRRAFCGSALAAIAATTQFRTVLAAADALRPVTADVSAVTGGGKTIALPRLDVEHLRASLRGALLLGGDDGYDHARRVWNGSFDRRPALIARCAGTADVIQAVNFVRAHELLVAVRGGGHSLSGQSVCEDGLMIDLSPMRSVRIDPMTRTAYVEPGVLLGEFDREAQSFGLATTAGTVSHTGVAGLTLGGGFGRIGRKYGLACDNLESVDIIPANGQLTRASAVQNHDLFWGVRGGGGNFGVVTSFEYRLHRVAPLMLGGHLIYPISQARDVLNFFADYIANAPDELWIEPVLAAGPDGAGVLIFDVCYCGNLDAGESALEPLRQFRKAMQDLVSPTPYVELQRSDDVRTAPGRCYYVKQGFLRRIEPALVDALVGHFEEMPRTTNVAFFHAGGAIGRVAPDATAFPHRYAQHGLLVRSSWDDRARSDEYIAAARATWRVVEPFTKGFYVNDLTPDHTQQRVNENYGANLGRLVALKRKYDPGNLFRMNANVVPNG